MKYDVIILASGKGERANLGFNKTFYRMKNGKRVLDCSIERFEQDQDCQRIIVVTNKENFIDVQSERRIIVTEGGKLRRDSVYNGLKLVESDYVLIHDGARPFIDSASIERIKEKLKDCDAVCLGHMSYDTVKYVEDGRIVKTLDRNNIFLAETPQAFKSELIKSCYEKCEDINFTDDASLVESLGYTVEIVLNDSDNRKLTNTEDFNNL